MNKIPSSSPIQKADQKPDPVPSDASSQSGSDFPSESSAAQAFSSTKAVHDSSTDAQQKEALLQGAKVRRRNLIISVVCGVLFIAFLIWAGRSSSSKSLETIQKLIASSGILGPILFVLISVFTSYIPIVPMGSMGSIGIVLFGALPAFFLNTLTSYINCLLAFWLGRRYGIRFLYQIASPQTVEKYEKRLLSSRRFALIFFLWMMLPVSPDLLLCMLAGLSGMKFSVFLAVILISRPFSSWCYSTGLLYVFNSIRRAVHL